jgi:hypothetical protein
MRPVYLLAAQSPPRSSLAVGVLICMAVIAILLLIA